MEPLVFIALPSWPARRMEGGAKFGRPARLRRLGLGLLPHACRPIKGVRPLGPEYDDKRAKGISEIGTRRQAMPTGTGSL